MAKPQHYGQCHCGAVRFNFLAGPCIDVFECNCSLCEMMGYQHLIVPQCDFTLLSDAASLILYEFNTQVAKHWFCKGCGVKSFYRPRSNPDGISINFRCVADKTAFSLVNIQPFDGQNWEKNAFLLDNLSKK